MAEVVLAYCSSHAPMMSSAREAAPKEQREHFIGALEAVKRQAQELDVQACVFLSNEHFTNFFLENFPQICVGVGDRNWGPTEEWLPIDKVWIPGHEGLANHIMRETLDHVAQRGRWVAWGPGRHAMAQSILVVPGSADHDEADIFGRSVVQQADDHAVDGDRLA